MKRSSGNASQYRSGKECCTGGWESNCRCAFFRVLFRFPGDIIVIIDASAEVLNLKPHIRITCVLTAILFAFAALSFSACKKSRDLSGSELWGDSLSDNAEPEAKEYETGLFDTGYVHQINVEIDEAD